MGKFLCQRHKPEEYGKLKEEIVGKKRKRE